MSHCSNSSLSLASMKETEGERVVRAIQKLAEKINELENERRLSRKNVETININELPSREVSLLFQRLAKAEARCKALQQQLSHIRQIVQNTSVQNLDVSVQSSKMGFQDLSHLADDNVSFETLPSITSLLLDNARKRNRLDQGLKYDRFQPDNSILAAAQVSTDNLPSGYSSDILEVPVDEYFRSSDGKDRIPTTAKKVKDIPRPDPESFTGNCVKTIPQDVPEFAQSIHRQQAFNFRNADIQKEIPGEMQKKRQRRGSTSRPRSDERSPLGQFLQPSSSKKDVKSHFHVRMNEIPFCSATTSGKTHSLGANLQNLMSMVKVCHPALCTAAPLHRRRSRSVDRKSCCRPTDEKSTCRKKLSRWNSTSSLDDTAFKHVHPVRRARSRSLDRTACSGSVSYAHSDLDLVPVKLKATKNLTPAQSVKSPCESPGNVCIKTEIKPLPVGSNKVVEVKMTTRAKMKGERSNRNDFDTKRRQLLKNVQELQYMVEKDQCC